MPRTAPRSNVRHSRTVEKRKAPAPAPAPKMKSLDFITMDVTPEMAAKWLEGKCPNRNVSDQLVGQYARDMVAGAWHLNGETIVFTDDEELLDGQHRLWAVVESGATVKMSIVKGASKDSMDTFDMGRARSFSDALKIHGQEHTRAMAGAARWLRWYDHFRTGSLTKGGKPSHQELKAILERHPMVIKAAEATATSKARRLVPVGILTFVMTGAMERDVEAATNWLNKLASGEDSADTSPVHVLRERMITNVTSTTRLSEMYVAAYTIKSWNAFYKRRQLRHLKWNANSEGRAEAFPTFEE